MEKLEGRVSHVRRMPKAPNMPDKPNLPMRKSPAKAPIVDIENRSNLIFITVCTKDRAHILANEDAHRILQRAWRDADAFHVGRYIILPDHIHLFCAPAEFPVRPIPAWVKYWKALATRLWPTPEQQPLWQKSCWDRQLRSGESYSEKWNYVSNNPVRHKLVSHTTDWPYQGELTQLSWHD
ncbi:MAG: REP-associated tyrosine transposase [Opitutaceae bacterium]